MIPENGTPVYHDGRLIGTIHHGELQQTRRPSNLLRWGISFDVGVLAEVERLGASRVRIKNSETGTIYTASIAAIRQLGRAVNYGYGEQIAMSFAHWQVTIQRSAEPTKQPKPAQVYQSNTDRKQAQPSLFDMAVTA